MNTEQLLEAAQTIRTIQLMLGESSNEWLPLIAAIGGAFVGGTFASITHVISGWAQRRNERRTITSALLSEIDSILYILEKRGYVEAVEAATKELEEGKEDIIKLTVSVSSKYSKVFDSCTDKIGVIDKGLATEIIKFHHLLESVIIDLNDGGFVAEDGGDVSVFRELRSILADVIKIGNRLREAKL